MRLEAAYSSVQDRRETWQCHVPMEMARSLVRLHAKTIKSKAPVIHCE
jgi:hypothetical protein